MRTTWYAVAVVAVLLGAVRAVQSGDDAETRAVIARAVKAQGGEAKMSKQKAMTLKGSGTYYGQGDAGVPFTSDWNIQAPRQIRVAIEGNGFRFVRVVNGDKGWIKLGDDATKALSKDQLKEGQDELYTSWVATLVPLKDKAFKLTPLGEVKVDGRDAVGVRVSREGHRDVSLYFDKAKHLLVKSETMVKDVQGGDKEYTQEMFQSDFKEIDGVKHAMKTILKRDGKRYVEVEWSEHRAAEKLDDSVFAMP